MAQTIKLKRSATENAVPTTSQLELGEVAINTYDGKMYIKKDVGGTESIVEVGGLSSVTLGGLSDVTVSSVAADQLLQYNGSAWVNVSLAEASAIMKEYQFTATAGQSTFTGADDNSETLSYTAGAIQVFLNGIFLDSAVDYTATSGTSIVLTETVDANDYLQVVAFKKKIGDGNVSVDTFTGDDSTVAFTLSVDPGDENNTRVFIDGVYQSKSNYSVSGTTLTFSTAPPTGTAVEVEIGNRVVTLDTLSDLDLPDDVKLRLGTGQDLEIFHNGTNSVINQTGTGDLLVQKDETTVAEFTVDGIVVTGDVEANEFIGDVRGAVLFKAQAGESLAKGDVVYISGISGNTTIVSKADADDASKMPAFGLVAAAASSGNPVDIYTNGILSGIDTSSYSEGDELFVSTTAGALTATAPTGEASALQKIGKVTRSASSGSIFIVGAGRTNAVPNLDDGDIFLGNSSNQAVSASLNTKIEEYLDSGVSTPTFAGLATTANMTFGDNDKAVFGAGSDLQIYHDGLNSIIADKGTGHLQLTAPTFRLRNDSQTQEMLSADEGGAVTAYYSGSQKFATTSTGIDVTGVITTDGMTTSADINFGDNDKAIFGAGSDLQIFSEGSGGNSFISEEGSGTLFIQGTDLRFRSGQTPKENFITAIADGAVTLYHNNAEKLATTSTGIDVTGTVEADGGNFTGQVQFDGTTGIQLDNGAQVHTWTLTDNFTSRLNIGTSSASAAWIFGSNNQNYFTVSPSGVIINQDSNDTDFRVESNNNDNMLFVDGGLDRVSIGHSSPVVKFDVGGATGSSTITPTEMVISTRTNASDWATGVSNQWGILGFYKTDGSGGGAGNVAQIGASMNNSTGGYGSLHFQLSNPGSSYAQTSWLTLQNSGSSGNRQVVVDAEGGLSISGSTLDFTKTDGVRINAAESLVVNIDSDNNDTGRVFQTQTGAGLVMMTNSELSGTVFNEGGESFQDFRVESDNNSHMLFVDAVNDFVGINKSSPEAVLHVKSSSAGAMTTFESSGASSSAGPNIRLWRNSASPAPGDGLARLVFQGMNSADERIDYAEIQTEIETANDGVEDGLFQIETVVAGTSRNRLRLNGTEAVFNDGGRNLDFRVESDSSTHALFVDGASSHVSVGTSASLGGARFNVEHPTDCIGLNLTGDGNQRYLLYFLYNGTSMGSVRGDANGVTYFTTSDRRLKDNIETITDGTDKLMAMNPVTHTWKADPEAPSVHGFIAQEMKEIVPEAVSKDTDPDEMMSMDYGRITPIIVAALQEANKKIMQLEERINELENK